VKPRVGLLGVGWIGGERLEAIVRDDSVQVVAIADPSPEARSRAAALAPGAAVADGLDGLLEQKLDGLVIATPSAQHASQAIEGLKRGVAVFCQKPLGRDAAEVAAVLDAARRADRLLRVDFSYRHARALQAVRGLVQEGELGSIYAGDLVFHNAYGPDKPWYGQREQSGGGCVIDLGIHLVDAALWILGDSSVAGVRAARWAKGERLSPGSTVNEDYATAEIELRGGGLLRLCCSWWLPAGQDCRIGVELWGTGGGAAFRNVEGSFYDFVAERLVGTRTERLIDPPDEWAGGAVVGWCRALAGGAGYDAAAERYLGVAEVVDAIYAS
jgi:predicted dehydrogenase